MSSGPKIHLDVNLLVQLIDVLQLRQKDDPDRDRAAAVWALQDVRNRLVHGLSSMMTRPGPQCLPRPST